MDPARGTSSRIQKVAIGFIGVGVVLFIVWQLRDELTPATRRLPDGTLIRFTRVAYQRPCRIVTAEGIRHSLGPMIPERWAKTLGCQYQKVGGGSNELLIAMEVERDAFKPTQPVVGRRAGLHGASLFDASGWESGLLSPRALTRSQSTRETVAFSFYPPSRDAETLGVRLYIQGRTNLTLAEFTFPNPMR